MLNSFTSKFKSFVFNSTPNDSAVKAERKRKRPVDESDDQTVQIVNVKKPKLQASHSENSTLPRRGFLLNSSIVQSMSDWVQKKNLFSWRSDRDKAKSSVQGRDGSKKTPGSNGEPDSNGRNHKPAGYHRPGLNQDSTHHRFQMVDVAKSYSMPTGSWPANTQNMGTDHLTRPAIHQRNSTQSRTVQTDSELGSTNGAQSASSFDKAFRTRNKHKFSAGESVRLEDKKRFQQLLQQFTSVPLETPDDSRATDPIKHPVRVPELTRFYFRSNSILGGNVSSDLSVPRNVPVVRERHRVKAQSSHKGTLKHAVNGSLCEGDSRLRHTDDGLVTPQASTDHQIDRIPSATTCIDLTDDPEEDRASSRKDRIRMKTPTSDYRESKFLSEDWIQNLSTTYSSKARERERKIREEEIRAKIYDERRDKEASDLERKIRYQMKIFEKEPVFIEEPPEVEVEKEEELPDLTEEMEKKISWCLRGGHSGEVLVDKFRLQITRNDIGTLSGLNWLNDEIINFYMNLLMNRGEQDGQAKVYAFNTFFYPKVIAGGQSAVKRWTRRVDVLAVDYLLVPVHLGMHWCLAVVDFKHKDIRYYDSMGGSNTQCLNALRQYLCDESQDKKKKEFDLNGWKTTIVKDIPQQMNGSDCGMFACKFADYITREARISFTQEHMPYFRRRMVYEIVTGKLLQ